MIDHIQVGIIENDFWVQIRNIAEYPYGLASKILKDEFYLTSESKGIHNLTKLSCRINIIEWQYEMKRNQLTKGQTRRIMYVENKDGDIDGYVARIGWVEFSKTGFSVYYRNRTLQRAKGGGI